MTDATTNANYREYRVKRTFERAARACVPRLDRPRTIRALEDREATV